MGRYWLCGWIVLGLGGSVVSGSARELELKYKMKPGQEFNYRDWLVLASQSSGEEVPEGARYQLESEAHYQQRVTSSENGVFELENRTLTGKMVVRFGEEERSEEIEERAEMVTLDERGKVLSRKDLDEDEKEEQEEKKSLLDFNLPLRVLDDIYENLLFPEKPVSIGQTWTDTVSIELSSEQTVAVDLTSKVTRLVQVRGRNCAEIETHFILPLNGSENGGGDSPVKVFLEGQMVGDLKLYFDYEKGIDLVHLGEINVILNTRMEVMAQSRESVTRTKIRLKTVLQETD